MKKAMVERYGRFHARFPLDDVYLGLPAAIRNDAYLFLLALNGHQRANEASAEVPRGVAVQIARMMGISAKRVLEALAAFTDSEGKPRVVELTPSYIRLIKYAKWQDTPEEIAELRSARAEAGRQGAIAGWERKRSQTDAHIKDARPATGQQEASNPPALAEQLPSNAPANAPANGQQIPAEREIEREKESLNTPPSPPKRRLSVVKDGYDDATAELAVGMHELLGRQLSTTEILECQVALNQYAYLSPAVMVDRAGAHVEYCKGQSPPLPTPRTVGGFSDSWRRHNDYLSDHGGAKADRVQLGRTGGLTRAFPDTESDASSRTPRGSE